MHNSVESAVSDYFGSSTVHYEEEYRVISGIISHKISNHGRVSNKDVVLGLINMLDHSDDVLEQDILRNALEIVLCRTGDYAGF